MFDHHQIGLILNIIYLHPSWELPIASIQNNTHPKNCLIILGPPSVYPLNSTPKPPAPSIPEKHYIALISNRVF